LIVVLEMRAVRQSTRARLKLALQYDSGEPQARVPPKVFPSPLRLPGSARDSMQAQEAKHARRRVKEDRRKASHARAAAEAAPVLAAAVALATAEAVPRQLMLGESGSAYRLSSRGEEPDWPGQPEGARAHLPESLSEHFGGEVVASPYLPPIV
jgi:hypothetical protein